MKCPCCGQEMERGRIETNALLHVIRYPASIIFEPDSVFQKKKSSSPFAQREGWYCGSCNKIVGIFDVGVL